MTVRYDVVVPTSGRSSLTSLIDALARAEGPGPRRIFIVDDRRDRRTPLFTGEMPVGLESRVCVVPGRAAGPACARNDGWRASDAEWIAFLDDDVVPTADWPRRLVEDIAGAGTDVGGSQGRIDVPLPRDRRPTDWERNVAGLSDALYATADMAYRRGVLHTVGGFDERFPRAYREDADLALRVIKAGYRIGRGTRRIVHPVGPADTLKSVRLQAGNADDALMRVLHGRRWRELAGCTRGRRPLHLLTTCAGAAGLAGLASGRRAAGLAGSAAWLALTLDFARIRIAPGPRTRREVMTLLCTSALIPAAATYHWLRGWIELPRKLRAPGPSSPGSDLRRPRAELRRDAKAIEAAS